MYVLGIDFGGGASKATLLDKNGQVVATATAEYPTHYGDGGKAEQNPMDWYNAACQNIRSVLQNINAEDVKCLCFDAATHTAVLMDENGVPICNSVYWTDTRSVKEKQYLAENFGKEIFEKCKHNVDTIWSLPEILFVKNTKPELYSKVKKVTFAKAIEAAVFAAIHVLILVLSKGLHHGVLISMLMFPRMVLLEVC
jgi:xylulokinase